LFLINFVQLHTINIYTAVNSNMMQLKDYTRTHTDSMHLSLI